MRIQFLGTGGYHPSERRQTACVLLPEIGVLFDAGTGAFRIPARLETDEIQIFLSHAHLDHIAGLTYLLVPMLHGQIRRAELFATPQVHEAVREHLFANAIFPVVPEFKLHVLEEGEPVLLPRGGELTHWPLVSHPGGSRAFRIEIPAEDGTSASFAYVTDTTVDGSYTDFIHGVDLLIHECYFPDRQSDLALQTGHSHTRQVVELARDAAVGRLMLVHIDPQLEQDALLGLDPARRIFAETDVATDLLQIRI